MKPKRSDIEAVAEAIEKQADWLLVAHKCVQITGGPPGALIGAAIRLLLRERDAVIRAAIAYSKHFCATTTDRERHQHMRDQTPEHRMACAAAVYYTRRKARRERGSK